MARQKLPWRNRELACIKYLVILATLCLQPNREKAPHFLLYYKILTNSSESWFTDFKQQFLQSCQCSTKAPLWPFREFYFIYVQHTVHTTSASAKSTYYHDLCIRSECLLRAKQGLSGQTNLNNVGKSDRLLQNKPERTHLPRPLPISVHSSLMSACPLLGVPHGPTTPLPLCTEALPMHLSSVAQPEGEKLLSFPVCLFKISLPTPNLPASLLPVSSSV